MTITSGLAQVGKTHLAINLALELVRRGRFAGVFHDAGQGADVGALLELQPLVESQQEDDDGRGVIRQGYQGIDVLGCEMPLREWAECDDTQRSRCIGSIDVQDGYDDFLIDTSGMDARSQLACCQAAAIVILIVTPEACSQAEAFALLQVLHLNGFSGELCLLVNKSQYAVDSKEIYDDFSRRVKRNLGLELSFLGSVPEDRYVLLAQHSRQAFTSLFPETGATGGVVVITDGLDDMASRVAAQQTLPVFLDKLLEAMQAPVCLPGDTLLEDERTPVACSEPSSSPAAGREQSGDLSLLQYTGDVPGLWRFLELLPRALQSLGKDLDELLTKNGDGGGQLSAAGCTEWQQGAVLSLLADLLGKFRDAAPELSVELDVTDTFVTGQQPCWLQSGCYLKYVFRLPQGPLPVAVTALLARVPNLNTRTTAAGEEVCEMLAPAHNSCLTVSSSGQAAPCIQVWLPVVRSDVLTGEAGRQGKRVAETPGKGLH